MNGGRTGLERSRRIPGRRPSGMETTLHRSPECPRLTTTYRWYLATRAKRLTAETVMFGMKTIFGDGVASRSPAQRATEAGVRCRALNIMTHQGMPRSERVAA
jgi:hypothetical protein